ncbi:MULTISPECIES: hypothetical protein [Marinobacter]|nr:MULTISPECIES: hypothetical protein [Marinobacter]
MRVDLAERVDDIAARLERSKKWIIKQVFCRRTDGAATHGRANHATD